MNRKAKTLPFLSALAMSLVQLATANDIEPGKEFYTAIRAPKPIVLDGNLAEWSGAAVLADPRFSVPKGSGDTGTLVFFELYDAGGPGTAVWTGPDDHTSAVQIVYDDDNVYFGFVVTDEYHENAANSAWNGDSVQLMIANDARDQQVALYNYALGGTEEALGNVIVQHEAGPGGTEAVVTRNTTTKRTIYEIKLPKEALGLESLTGGTKFGLGMAINDGDKDAPGQQGWGGLGAHSIVFGKTPSETALVTLAKSNDIEPGKEFYTANPAPKPIVLDGNLSEWSGVPVLADPRFSVPKGSGRSGTLVLFELYDAGGPGTAVWTGPDDHTSAVQVVYDSDNVYFGFVVTDEYHENAANSAWNGDSVQLMIANGAQDQQVALYNYALGGTEEALGQVIVQHEAGPGGTEAVVTRNTTTKRTFYEIKLPKESLGLDSLVTGTQFGLGMAINDGDKNAPGQQGWGGLGAHSIVFGKTPSETALVTLGIGGTGADLIFLSAINPTFRGLSFRATDKGASIVDPTSAKLFLDGQSVPLTASPKQLDATDFTYTRPTPFLPSSEHTYTIELKDTLGQAVSSSGNFKLPSPWFPLENLPGPNVVNKAWAVRHVFGAGTISDIPTVIATLKAVGTPQFTGASVDTTSEVINYGNAGLFANGLPYPDAAINDPLWTGEDFIQFSVGHIEILEQGDYTFGVHSDDGFGLRIRGGEAIRVSGNGQLDPADPEAVVHPANTGDSNTRAVYHLKKGVYRLEFFWWERGGGDHGELYAAKGSFTNDADTDQWRLAGDNTPSQEFFRLGVDDNGWTVVSSDVGGDPLNSWADGLADLEATAGNPTQYDALDVGDPQTNAGTQPFPKDTGADDDDYALRANATLVVPANGTYTIGFNSDDGAYVKITGQNFIEIISNATGLSVIDPTDTVTCDCLTGDSATTATITLAAGNYPIEAGMFERGGGSYLRARGAQSGSPSLPVLARNGAGIIRTGEALQLTDRPTGVTESPVATISRSGNNIIIQWTPTGGTLEWTPSLSGTPTWTVVGTDNPATIAIGTANGFYRVRQ